MNRITQELITRILRGARGVELVECAGERPAYASLVEEHRADVLITDIGGEELSEFDPLLDRCPRVAVLAVAGDGRSSFLYRLRPQRERLGELSPNALVEAVRGVAA